MEDNKKMGKAVGYECPYCGANLVVAPESDHCRCRFCDSYIEIQRDKIKEIPNNVPAQPVNNNKTGKDVRAITGVILTVALLTVFCTLGSCVSLLVPISQSTQTQESKEPAFKTISCKDSVDISVKGFSGFAELGIISGRRNLLTIDGLVIRTDVTPGRTALKNGDKLSIHFEIDGEVAKSNRLDIVDTDFEYTVSGLNTYITSLEEDKELLGDLQNLATQAIINKEAVFLSKPQSTPQISSYLGYVICVDKDGEHSTCCLLYETNIQRDNATDTVYIPVFFKNIYEDAEGNIVADYKPSAKSDGYIGMGSYSSKESYSVYGYKTFDEFVLNQIKNAKSENYVYTDIAE